MGERDKETERETETEILHSVRASVYDCERAQVRRVPVRACCQQTLRFCQCVVVRRGETERDRARDRGRLVQGKYQYVGCEQVEVGVPVRVCCWRDSV